MADDDRRAEIEAVAEALWDDTTARWAEPVAFAEANDKSRESYLNDARIAVAALDRVRDARGDDEAGVVYALRRAVSALGAAAVAFRKLDEGTGYPPHIAADNAKRAEDHAREALRRYDREREAARSPQDEDHEEA